MKKSSSLFVLALGITFVFLLANVTTSSPEKSENISINSKPILEGKEVGEFLKPQVFELKEDLTANASSSLSKKNHGGSGSTTTPTTTPVIPPPTNSFVDSFSPDYSVLESSPMSASSDLNWWVNSGASLIASSGIGQTVQGELVSNNKWRLAYLASNPIDTDQGFHPQNIFRLVQRRMWQNFIEEAYFKINKMNISASPNRNASNGLFLFNRYQNGDNLYYTGIRVDGAVVIKKKINGIYYTMAYQPFISTGIPYDIVTNPNLLPLGIWIGLRSEVNTNTDGTVTINFYIDTNRTGNWTLALSAIDDNKTYGGGAITNPGYAGIRTDFMDVSFDDFSITNL